MDVIRSLPVPVINKGLWHVLAYYTFMPVMKLQCFIISVNLVGCAVRFMETPSNMYFHL